MSEYKDAFADEYSYKEDKAIFSKDYIQAVRLCSLALNIIRHKNGRTTSELKSLSELINPSKSDEKAKAKAFTRDIKALEKIGVYTNKKKDSCSNEQILTCDIDKTLTKAELNLEQKLLLSTIMLPLLQSEYFPYPYDLLIALNKLGCNSFIQKVGQVTKPASIDTNRDFHAYLKNAMNSRLSCKLKYKTSQDKTHEYIFDIYDMFTLDDHKYIIGHVTENGEQKAIYKLREDRILEAEIIKSSTAKFTRPTDFKTVDHIVLPFQIGEKNTFVGTFFVPTEHVNELNIKRKRKGSLNTLDNGALWKIKIKNTKAAVRFAIANALIPVEPKELVDTYKNSLMEVLS